MPYRRLPNTDDARIRALQSAIREGETQNIQNPVVSLRTLGEADVVLRRLQDAQKSYRQSLKIQSNANQNYQAMVKNARLYVSHFIQVLNLSIIRNEIKKEQKAFYELEPDDFSIPDMISETALLAWGEKIIIGENKRVQYGGAPIYNPTIAKVKVYYDMFKDAYYSQKSYQKNTSRMQEAINEQREPADKIIADIWNQVEDKFKELEGEDRLNCCRKFGVVYYYRRGEKQKV